MVQIVGKYEHERSENLEEYLKTVVGEEHADKASTFAQSKPVLEVQNNGDDFTITVSNDGKSNTTTFQLGVPYDETMPHGVTMKVRGVKNFFLFLFPFFNLMEFFIY